MFQPINISRNARHIRQVEKGRPDLHFACACTDGTVLVAKADGTTLWEASFGCFPWDLWVGDINGDQQDEVLVAGSDGVLYAYSSEGKALWSYRTAGPLFQVCVAAMGKSKTVRVFAGGADHFLHVLDAQGAPVKIIELPVSEVPGPPHDPGTLRTGRGAVKFIRAGDIDGSGETTVVVWHGIRVMHNDLLFIKGGDLEVVDEISRFEREIGVIRGNDLWKFDIFDADGDGIDEMVIGQGSWKASGLWVYRKSEKAIRWKSLHEANAMHRVDTVYRDTHAVPVDIDGKRRLAAVCGQQVCVLDPDLEILRQAFAQCAFMGIAAFTHGGESGVLLASGFGGDQNVYRLQFGANWVNELEGYARSGSAAEVSRQIDALFGQVLAAPTPVPPPNPAEPYLITVGACFIYRHTLGEVEHYLAHNQWVRKQFPYPNLKLATLVAISEKQDGWLGHASLLGSRFEAEDVIQILQKFEEQDVPFLLVYSQGFAVSLTTKTIERVIAACPNTFQGFLAGELGLNETAAPGRPNFLEEFLDASMLPMLELMLAHGKKCLINEKNCSWISGALNKGVFSRLFSGKYRDVIIPSVEDSSTCSPELNLAGRIGLWLAGSVNRWGTRTTNDDYGNSWCKHGGNPVMSGHQSLRKMVSQAALGATSFQFNCGQDNGSGEPCYSPTQGNMFLWTRVGRESMVPFLHMLGKGLLRPPARGEMSGISRVALSIEPCASFIESANNSAHFEDFPGDLHEGEFVFSRLSGQWNMAPAHPNHFPALAFNQKQQGTNFVPETPYGFVAILPAVAAHGSELQVPASPGSVPLAFDLRFGSDGEAGFLDGKIIPPAEWREKFLAALRDARDLLPFCAEGHVFMNAIPEASGFTICLADADCVQHHDKKVALHVQDKNITRVTDKLTGETLPMENRTVHLTIPAGTLLLLRAT